jgi:DNA-binding MarR family transcriptional regulator
MSKYPRSVVAIDEKVSQLTDYLIRMYESRDSWAKQACMHSPISTLGRSEVRVLEALDCGEPVNMGSLSDKTALPLSTLTGIVDKLVDKGFLERTRSCHDRRVVEVGTTDFGRRSLDHRKSAHQTKSRNILACLDPVEQDTLLRLLSKIVNT